MCGNELCVDGLWYTSVETAAAPPHANRPPPQPKKRAHDHLQVCSKCRTSRADTAELQILFPRHEPYGTSVQLAALEKSRIAAALQVASDAHGKAQDEAVMAAKLAEDAAGAEADAQADAALAQVAAEEKAAAAAAELLRAQAVKAFNDAFSAVKTQDLEAERLTAPRPGTSRSTLPTTSGSVFQSVQRCAAVPNAQNGSRHTRSTSPIISFLAATPTSKSRTTPTSAGVTAANQSRLVRMA